MPVFIMHTKSGTDATVSTESLKALERLAMDHIRSQFPSVTWINVFVLGHSEYIETFSSPDMNTALEIATFVRSFQNADVKVWPAS